MSLQELKEELTKKVNLKDLFDLWFNRSSSRIAELLKKDGSVHPNMFNEILEQQYVELMTECMK